jgi:hypothetical protein
MTPSRILRSPFAWAVMAGLAVLLAAFVPVLLQMLQPRPVPRALFDLPAPWQIEAEPNGPLKAFGLRLPGSTLADAVALWGDELQVGVIESRGQAAALEAYTDRWTGGGVGGKLVLAIEASGANLLRWQEQSPKRERLDANAQRSHLRFDDREAALRGPVVGLSFLPAQKLDAATLKARFGEPAEVIAGEGGTQHWLYPSRGLAIARDDASGRLLLQVVAVADFENRLRAPLQAAAVKAAAPPASGPPR